MSFYRHARALPRRFRLILASFLQRPGLPFADVLEEDAIQKTFDDEEATFADDEDAVYTPAITMWAFLSQVLFKDEHRSCVAAVARVVVLLVALERGPCSTNTGAYCRARGKLSEKVIRRLTIDVGEGCETKLDKPWLWHGRSIYLVDGTTVSMPDTPENQEAYPQNPQQKEGLGFPIARVVVLLSLASGMLTGMAMGPYAGKETGESALLRSLLGRFKRGDMLLADRYYCSYFMIALLQERGIDLVARLHQRRPVDFRRGRRLGKDDQLVTWSRPKRPHWMDEQTYDRVPASIEIRAIRVHVRQPGFRVGSFVAVTTLTDAKRYAKDEIASLYHCRWLAELDIRAIKITMGMDILRCKTPEMVRKEMWTCLLAYNLIRQTMLQSAQAAGVSPRSLSFTAAMQSIAASWLLVALSDDALAGLLIDAALASVAEHVVGNRAGRIEPRAIKRRPKQHALLTKPRDQARAELLKEKSM
ncbi:MAG: IS4 family transposase [Gammaproteobacteria bacterium]|nr:MAG: IS4 family transposase [Gammaproteobacteria bacterium]